MAIYCFLIFLHWLGLLKAFQHSDENRQPIDASHYKLCCLHKNIESLDSLSQSMKLNNHQCLQEKPLSNSAPTYNCKCLKTSGRTVPKPGKLSWAWLKERTA